MLSFEEFLGEETHIEKIFRTMDKDNDGSISEKEYIGDIYKVRYCCDFVKYVSGLSCCREMLKMVQSLIGLLPRD